MDWAAQNSGYVIASYAISALALVAMVVAILWRDQRAAKDTEKRIDRV
jgi:heme exporter protein CcmD